MFFNNSLFYLSFFAVVFPSSINHPSHPICLYILQNNGILQCVYKLCRRSMNNILQNVVYLGCCQQYTCLAVCLGVQQFLSLVTYSLSLSLYFNPSLVSNPLSPVTITFFPLQILHTHTHHSLYNVYIFVYKFSLKQIFFCHNTSHIYSLTLLCVSQSLSLYIYISTLCRHTQHTHSRVSSLGPYLLCNKQTLTHHPPPLISLFSSFFI